MSLADVPVLDAARVASLLDWRTALNGLTDFLAQPQPPSAPRSAFACRAGELLLMPAESGAYVGVKVISLNHDAPPGVARAQGIYTLFDAGSLSPVALLDAVELTLIRTAAVSALAMDRLAMASASRLVVFGTGPQAIAHAQAIAAVRELDQVVVVGRRPEAVAAVCTTLIDSGLPTVAGSAADVASADIVACCTASATPLFDSTRLPDSAAVVAMGSHHPDRREVDAELVRTSFVVVESRDNALREAGDIVLAGDDPASLIDATLVELVTGTVVPPSGDESSVIPPSGDEPSGSGNHNPTRRLFKSVGEAWQDLAMATLAFELHTR